MKNIADSKSQARWEESFSHDLKTAAGMEFPIYCSVCGMQFSDAELFLHMTTPAFDKEGINETYDHNGKRVLDVGRFCPCAHLMVEEFKTRRDESLEGRMFRSIFSNRLLNMRSHGVDKTEAHEILMNVMQERGRRAIAALEVG